MRYTAGTLAKTLPPLKPPRTSRYPFRPARPTQAAQLSCPSLRAVLRVQQLPPTSCSGRARHVELAEHKLLGR